MKVFGKGVLVAGFTVLTLTNAGCTKDIGKAAVEYINTEIAKLGGFGKLDTKCDPAPAKPKAGDTFKCKAATSDGKVLDVLVTVTEGDKFTALAVNFLPKALLTQLVSQVLPAIKEQAGQEVEAANVNCGDKDVILDASNSMECEVTIPSAGSKHKMSVTMNADKTATVKVDMPPPPPAQPSDDAAVPESEEGAEAEEVHTNE